MKEDLAEDYTIRKWLRCFPSDTEKGIKRTPFVFIAGGLAYVGLGFVFGGLDYKPEYLIEFIKGGLIGVVTSLIVIPFFKNKEDNLTEANPQEFQNQQNKTGANKSGDDNSE